VELIQGEILTMALMGEPHALTIIQLTEAFLPRFNTQTGYHLRGQCPPPPANLNPILLS
jgi:hypothetical protein